MEIGKKYGLEFPPPSGACERDPTGARLAIYENQRPEVDKEFAGRFDKTTAGEGQTA